MSRSRLALVVSLLVWGCAASAADYPNQPIHLVTPYGAASSNDQMSRSLGKAIGEATGQAVIVDNKPGADGVIGTRYVASAKPDGYTILISNSSTAVLNALQIKDLPYDTIKDFIPIRSLGQSAFVMAVNVKSPYKTAQEFIAAAAKQPGRLTYGSGSTNQRLAGELLQSAAHIKLLNVPYRTSALSMTDLLGGQVDLMFADVTTVAPYLKAGTLRALGVTGTSRMAALPDVPTLAETGVKGYSMTYWYGAWLPANTPPAVVAKSLELFDNAMAVPEVKNYFSSIAIEPLDLRRDAFLKLQLAEIEKYRSVIHEAGMDPK
jgi:tripartite-type tricarboxylate transporter receptor subunit TctC